MAASSCVVVLCGFDWLTATAAVPPAASTSAVRDAETRYTRRRRVFFIERRVWTLLIRSGPPRNVAAERQEIGGTFIAW
ncbi:hypothetical protein JCM9957A_25430 [Kineosporia succinea]